MQKMQSNSPFLSLAAASRALNVPIGRLRKMAKCGQLNAAAVPMGGRTYYEITLLRQIFKIDKVVDLDGWRDEARQRTEGEGGGDGE